MQSSNRRRHARIRHGVEMDLAIHKSDGSRVRVAGTLRDVSLTGLGFQVDAEDRAHLVHGSSVMMIVCTRGPLGWLPLPGKRLVWSGKLVRVSTGSAGVKFDRPCYDLLKNLAGPIRLQLAVAETVIADESTVQLPPSSEEEEWAALHANRRRPGYAGSTGANSPSVAPIMLTDAASSMSTEELAALITQINRHQVGTAV